MSMQFTGLQVVSWILLLIGSGVLLISLVSDYWSTHLPKNHMDNLAMNRGILRQCIKTTHYGSCNFRLSRMFKQLRNFMDGHDMYSDRTMYRHLPTQAFEVFVALLMVIAVLIAGTVLFFGPFCCQKCKASTTLLIFISSLFATTGCLIYWNANRVGKTFTLQQLQFQEQYHYDHGTNINNLSWSFYMASSSCSILLFSSFLLCISSRVDPDVEYEPPATAV